MHITFFPSVAAGLNLFAPAAAMFFGMSTDEEYAAPFAPGAAIPFPSNGPTVGADAPTRLTDTTFRINVAGTYEVSYQGSFDEAGQLALAVGGLPVANTRAGRASVTDQISNTVLMTLADLAVLSLVNDLSAGGLTVTPTPGGSNPGSVVLVIRRVG